MVLDLGMDFFTAWSLYEMRCILRWADPWTYTGRKTLPPSKSFPLMGEIAGVNMASLGGYFHSSKTRARWAGGFHDELNGHVFDLERDGFRQVVLCPRLTMR